MDPYSKKISTALAVKNMTSLVNSGMMYFSIQLGSSAFICSHFMIGDLNSQIRYMASYFSIKLLDSSLSLRDFIFW